MEIILTEKVIGLGIPGDVVCVKNGYARNYLIPRNKALRATKENLQYFSQQKTDLEQKNVERRALAESIAAAVKDVIITIEKIGGDDGRLYGSVTKGEFIKKLKDEKDIDLSGYELDMGARIKSIGEYQVKIKLHPEVEGTVTLYIRRSGLSSLNQANSVSTESQVEHEITNS